MRACQRKLEYRAHWTGRAAASKTHNRCSESQWGGGCKLQAKGSVHLSLLRLRVRCNRNLQKYTRTIRQTPCFHYESEWALFLNLIEIQAVISSKNINGLEHIYTESQKQSLMPNLNCQSYVLNSHPNCWIFVCCAWMEKKRSDCNITFHLTKYLEKYEVHWVSSAQSDI